MASSIRLVLNNNISDFQQIRNIIDNYTGQGLISDDMNIKINLVLDEMFTNIVSYAFTDGGQHDITVDIECDNEKFKSVLTDDGFEFDPLKYEVQDLNVPLNERKIGGLGIHLMKNLMDEYQYKRENNKNILTLIKLLN